jgi:hypothetical protein
VDAKLEGVERGQQNYSRVPLFGVSQYGVRTGCQGNRQHRKVCAERTKHEAELCSEARRFREGPLRAVALESALMGAGGQPQRIPRGEKARRTVRVAGGNQE